MTRGSPAAAWRLLKSSLRLSLAQMKETGSSVLPHYQRTNKSTTNVKMEGGCLGDVAEEQNNEFIKMVENIPLTFVCEEHYFDSFVYPLLEETRAELASSMEIMYRSPFIEILSFNESKCGENMVYDVSVGPWKNLFSERDQDAYQTLPGDLLVLVDGKPEDVSDLRRVGRTWALSSVKSNEYDSTSLTIKVKASKPFEFQYGMFVVFVMNITTQKRIWNSLHIHKNLNIIKEFLYSNSAIKESCNICSVGYDSTTSQRYNQQLLVNLNESQRAAIMVALSKTQCCHGSSVEQIWGPPGTGKTMTVSVLLFLLLQMNHRTLACAPTNVAIVQLASRLLSLVRESFKITTASGDYFSPVGDVVLFGTKERLNVSTDIEEIFLEHRVKRLVECLGPVTGWKHCIRSMIDLLENCVSEYYIFVENELLKKKQQEVKSFIEFMRDRFNCCALPLRRCIITFCTHISRSFIGEYNFQNMISLLDYLSSLESLLFHENLVSEELQDLFTSEPMQDDRSSISFVRAMSLSVLTTMQQSLDELTLPSFLNKYAITQFCFERASVIFCTTSSSHKLHAVSMEPLDILVIDEAAQLKEAESIIPLQLPRMKHAILIGDEHQLPPVVNSNLYFDRVHVFGQVCSGFGRSLFDRLSSLGYSKHLLNVQYRMHPSISVFPNRMFYHNQIQDAPNVLSISHEKTYLSGPMFGSYSFINVVVGREEKDDNGRSRRNMVEVAIVLKIVQNLYKAWKDSKLTLTIGVISPYVAQVVSIQEKIAHKYDKLDGFSVKVKSVDGFQGGEEDIIILSTVRSNSNGSVGFISSPQRTNVAFTRARHCLWILGNEKTLTNSESIWKELVCDARNRHCLFDADSDECLKTTIIAAKKELDQLDDLVNGNSVLFKHAKWKVLFSDDFRRSLGKLMGSHLKKLVLNLLLKLSSGWRPKNKSVDLCCETSSQILKQFKVEGLYVICTIDIIKEVNYIQVLKVWDILALEEIPKLKKRLESVYSAYTNDFNNRCTEKCLEGSFITGRSGTGKTTVLTTKLFQHEQKFRIASDGIYEGGSSQFRGAEVVNDHQDSKTSGLRQLFVTVSPHLCYAVKQNVSHLTSISSNGNSIAEINLDDTDVITSEFNDIPDTLTNIPVKSYPLVLTFQKFLMMLDGTLGNSFFNKFPEAREGSHGNMISSRSVALQTFIRIREVTFDRFCSVYWPHFNSDLTKKLDCSRVFTEIISHIKGGLQAGECSDGRLSCESYSLLAESRSSTLTKEKREIVYKLFQAYEKMKTARGEFDLGDFVNDIHRRLKNGKYGGDQMDFVTLMKCKIVLLFHSIDNLEPEISLISGEAPVLLESGNDENAIVTIFGGSESSGEVVGFGAEQVILVRDERAKTEICKYVGKQALVLTILECKGLEFHDVLLYNFFWTFPLKDQWRVIYGYMKKYDWFDEKLPQSFPTFTEARHGVLCSELKQLYVAITRTRQRLWISGDTIWEKLAKASGLRASADQMRGTNHEAFKSFVREVAGIFESIGKLESAASCYCDLGEYERAGKIYLYTRGKIDAAAKCFTLSGCYSDAAEAYAKGDMFSNCLSVCIKGKLFDKGMQYIEYRKEHVNVRSKEMLKIEQEFLENCALDYHEHNDPKSMMKFVRAFCSMKSKREFLKSLGRLDYLLSLEEESGHLLEAVELARSLGDVVKEADLLEKAGNFVEAAFLVISYLYVNSLWGNGNKGWPLKQFPQKEEYCNKVKSLAEKGSYSFYDFVCSELKVLSAQRSSLTELKQDLDASLKTSSLTGEILSIRKILDAHFRLSSSKYEWEDELPIDINKHCEDKMFQNRVSVRTLWFIIGICGRKMKHCVNGNKVYQLLNKDAHWIRNTGHNGLRRNGECLTIDFMELVLAIQSYWESELLSVGIKVLKTLEGLHKLKSNGSAFHQGISLLHICYVSHFLFSCKYLKLTPPFDKIVVSSLQNCKGYFDLMFPLDWRRSMSEDLISLRTTDLSDNLLHAIVFRNVDIMDDLDYWDIGRVMMACIGSRTSVAIYKLIINKLESKPMWKLFIGKLMDVGYKEHLVLPEFMLALKDAFRANRKAFGYISPDSLVYLLDRLLFVVSWLCQTFYTAKSSFAGWFTHLHSTATPTKLSPKPKILKWIIEIVQEILSDRENTNKWCILLAKDYHKLLALKLVMMLALILLEESDYSQVLLDFLIGSSYIADLLPEEFVSSLLRRREGRSLNLNPEVVAEAFMSVKDPLVIVCRGDLSPKIHAPCAIFVDLNKTEEEIMGVLFPRKNTLSVNTSQNVSAGAILEPPSRVNANLSVNPVNESRGELQLKLTALKEISEFITRKKGDLPSIFSMESAMKTKLDLNVNALATALEDRKFCTGEDITLVFCEFSKLKVLLEAFDPSSQKLEHSVFMKNLDGVLDWLDSSRPKLDDFLKRYGNEKPSVDQMVADFCKRYGSQKPKGRQMVVSECSISKTEVEQVSHDARNKTRKGNKGRRVNRAKAKRNDGINTMAR
ncbi:Reverse transcriptase, RNA-dependent DNA polymerase [Artemisia annua]|uniref:Reverse transcriptase, RNA-dependent DNA polymerase n=1 Tax=Artemisia annua TaxID=35608 RepID=A0A2U1NT57_ARTAN|nr:Reverse transcriptase, RNA-dependent DNA polymerase [Artemisia annua]